MKLFKIIFVLLLVITIAEVGYYVYFYFNKDKITFAPLKNIVLSPSLVPTQETTSSAIVDRVKTPIQMLSQLESNAFDPALLDSILLSSKYIKKDLLKLYKISTVLEGEITEITFPDSQQLQQSTNIPRVFIVIKGEQGGLHQYGIPQESKTQTSSVDIYSTTGAKIDLADLKVGDKVRISVDTDITNSKLEKTVNKWIINKI